MNTVGPSYSMDNAGAGLNYDEQSCNPKSILCSMNPHEGFLSNVTGEYREEDYIHNPAPASCNMMDLFGSNNGGSLAESAASATKMSKASHKARKWAAAPSTSQPMAPAQCRKPVIIHTYSPKIIKTEAHNFMQLVQKLTGWNDGEDEDDDDCPRDHCNHRRNHKRRKKKKKKKKKKKSEDDDDQKNSELITLSDPSATNSSTKSSTLAIGPGEPNYSADSAAQHAINSGYIDPSRASSNKRITGIDINNIEYSTRSSPADRFVVPRPRRTAAMNAAPRYHRHQYARNLRNLQISAASAMAVNPMLSRQTNYATLPAPNCGHNFLGGIMNPSSLSYPMILVDDSCANFSHAFCPPSLQQPINPFPHLISSMPSNLNMNYMPPGLGVDLPLFSEIAPPVMSSDHSLHGFPCKQTLNYFQSIADHDHQSSPFANPNSHDHVRFVESQPSSASLGINDRLYNISSELLPQTLARDFEHLHKQHE